MSQQLKQQILQPPTVLRPKFRVSKADRDESWHITSLCTGCRALSGISSARPFNHNTLSNCFKTWSLLRRHLDICRSITTASSRPWVCSHPLAPNRGVQGKSRIQQVGWCRRACDGDMSPIVFADDLSSHKKLTRPPLHIRTGGRRVNYQLLGGASLSTMRRPTRLIPTEIHSRRVRFQKAVLNCVLRYKPLIHTSSDQKIEDEGTKRRRLRHQLFFVYHQARQVGFRA